MKEFGLFSIETGDLIYGIGQFESEEEAIECAEYCAREDGIPYDQYYVSER